MFVALLSPRYEQRCGGYSISVISCLHLLSEQKRRCGGHSTLVISCFTQLSLDKATPFTSEKYPPRPPTMNNLFPGQQGILPVYI